MISNEIEERFIHNTEIVKQVVSWVISETLDDEELEAYASVSYDFSVRSFKQNVDEFESAFIVGVGIRSISDHKMGFSYSGSLDIDNVRAALAEARSNKQFAETNPHVSLPLPETTQDDLEGIFCDDNFSVSNADKIQAAIELDEKLTKADPKISHVEQANYGEVFYFSSLANSKGLLISQKRSSCYLSAYVLAGEAPDVVSAGSFSFGRRFTDLDINHVVGDAANRALRLLGAKKVATRPVCAVFEPRMTATLLSILSDPLNGERVAKGRSFFASRIGESVASENLTLIDDPRDKRSIGATVYDAEGVPTRENVLINSGKLVQFLQTTESASRNNLAKSNGCAIRSSFGSTPTPGARNFKVAPGSYTQEEIISGVENGVLVQSMTGIHSGVNPISGDFSVGCEGLLIENGKLVHPIKEMTLGSTIQKMLAKISAIGNDTTYLPGSAVGVTLAIEDMVLSGN